MKLTMNIQYYEWHIDFQLITNIFGHNVVVRFSNNVVVRFGNTITLRYVMAQRCCTYASGNLC